MKNKHSKKYAKMFLGALSADLAERGLAELSATVTLMNKSEGFASLMTSPVFGAVERAGAIEAVGAKLGFVRETIKFLIYLASEGAGSALAEVHTKALAIYLERRNRVRATVVTPVPVGAEYESRLKESIKKLTNKDVEIEYALDPSLIGGMLVKVGSTMYDGTLKGQLRLLKDELTRG